MCLREAGMIMSCTKKRVNGKTCFVFNSPTTSQSLFITTSIISVCVFWPGLVYITTGVPSFLHVVVESCWNLRFQLVSFACVSSSTSVRHVSHVWDNTDIDEHNVSEVWSLQEILLSPDDTSVWHRQILRMMTSYTNACDLKLRVHDAD